MGLLNLPSPTLSAIDGWLSPFLPPAARLLVWAALGAVLSMEIYRLLSPQSRIVQIKRSFEEMRRRVADFDGEFEDVWPDMRRMISLALRRIMLVFPATIAASLPLLVVIVWISTQYGATYPPANAPVAVSVPGGFEGRWVGADAGTPHARVMDRDGRSVADIAVLEPVPIIHKRLWWNALIGNPAGYLDDALPFDQIDIALPRRQILSFGPMWLRGWEVTFFAAMIAFALIYKSARRIT
ncbi:hypothetical protein [Chelativorans salis]|uniref:Uncharacterized protein n=1 Tax=Chelativorans salis TaxID=2978478 RepID=A0ABT2LIQ2_9HYPH|nr:hypothetical protein [Chelativorans sp. EGI FJ00035]MCT7373692.1 hypothetical protein [Chelativorans sp. EGI FJ00035]